MSVRTIQIGLAIFQTLLIVVGLVAGVRHAKHSRWAVVIAAAFGIQTLALALYFAPWVAPGFLASPSLTSMIQGLLLSYWGVVLSMLAILGVTIALAFRMRVRSAATWAVASGAGGALHLLLLTGHEIATRLRWHTNAYGRLSDNLSLVVAAGHAAAQASIVLGVLGIFAILGRVVAPVPRAAQGEATSNKGYLDSSSQAYLDSSSQALRLLDSCSQTA